MLFLLNEHGMKYLIVARSRSSPRRWPERFLSVFREVQVRYVLDWMKNMAGNKDES